MDDQGDKSDNATKRQCDKGDKGDKATEGPQGNMTYQDCHGGSVRVWSYPKLRLRTVKRAPSNVAAKQSLATLCFACANTATNH